MDTLFTKLKTYCLAALALVGVILGGLVVYWKRVADIDQTIIDEQKMNEVLAKQDSQLKDNHAELTAEEQKRKEIENAPSTPTNISDISDWFNRRK